MAWRRVTEDEIPDGYAGDRHTRCVNRRFFTTGVSNCWPLLAISIWIVSNSAGILIEVSRKEVPEDFWFEAQHAFSDGGLPRELIPELIQMLQEVAACE